MIYMFFIGYIIGGIVGAFILACILLANKMCVVIKGKNKDEEIKALTKANENLKVLYQDIVTQSEWHEEYYKKEIERLTEDIRIFKFTIKTQQEQIQELITKEDKAIEYLKLFDDNSTLIDHSIIKGALNILQGSDSNE